MKRSVLFVVGFVVVTAAAAILVLRPGGEATAVAPAAPPAPPPGPGATPAAPAAAGAAAPADDDAGKAADSRLLNAIIQAQTAFDPEGRALAAAYARDFGEGPEPRRAAHPQLHAPAGGKEAMDRLEAALASSPGDDALRAAARAYVTACRTLMARVDEAALSYGAGAQKGDGHERGVALHRPLLEGFRAYLDATAALGAEGRRRADERRARTKARLLAEGRRYRLRAIEVVEQARALDDLLVARKQLTTVSPAELDRAVATLAATVESIGQLTGDESGARRELGPRATQYAALAKAASSFLGQARETVRQAKENRSTGQAGSPKDPRDELLRQFNDLVTAASKFGD